jgi:hypothetical protein
VEAPGWRHKTAAFAKQISSRHLSHQNTIFLVVSGDPLIWESGSTVL